MANFKSEPISIAASASKVFDKLSNLEALSDLLKHVGEENIPEDKREIFNNISITPDTITIPGGPTGPITLRMSEKVAPSLIRLSGEGTPVALSLSLHISPVGDEACEAFVDFDLAIPPMLKPMVSGPMKKMTDQFAQVLRAIRYD